MTAGLAFEGMNHAGFEKDANLLVVLNDNCMSIDPNVGALKEYLTDITTSHTYNKVKDEVWHLLGKVSKFGPDAQKIASKVTHALKGSILKQSNLFESLNFRYFGPVDGHDVVGLAKVLEDLKDIPGPKILHCLTKKGGGYKECGRKSANGSKRGYPKCVPAAKAARMSESQKRSAVIRKRSVANVGPKPTNVKTIVNKPKKMKDGGIYNMTKMRYI
jgi:deoxyxylulose-5-phosphate synthase